MSFHFLYILNIMQYLNHESWNKHIYKKRFEQCVRIRNRTESRKLGTMGDQVWTMCQSSQPHWKPQAWYHGESGLINVSEFATAVATALKDESLVPWGIRTGGGLTGTAATDQQGRAGQLATGWQLIHKRMVAALRPPPPMDTPLYLEDHVHLAKAGQSLIPDRGQQLLNIWMRHKLNNKIIRLLL